MTQNREYRWTRTGPTCNTYDWTTIQKRVCIVTTWFTVPLGKLSLDSYIPHHRYSHTTYTLLLGTLQAESDNRLPVQYLEGWVLSDPIWTTIQFHPKCFSSHQNCYPPVKTETFLHGDQPVKWHESDLFLAADMIMESELHHLFYSDLSLLVVWAQQSGIKIKDLEDEDRFH